MRLMVDDVEEINRADVLFSISECFLPDPVDKDDAPIRIHALNYFIAVFQQFAVPVLRLPEGFLITFTFGDIPAGQKNAV